MAATFVNVIEEFLEQLADYFLSNNHFCVYTKTVIRLRLSELFLGDYSTIFKSPSANNC